jgi:uncharacterized membrane protein YbaN (DUF454 family)
LVTFCAGVEHSIARHKRRLHKGLVIRAGYLVAGFISLALGALGLALPLLPTVPFVILAAFCFARSSPELERRLVEHRTFGPHIRSWRTRGAISRRGKMAAAIAFAFSAAMGLVLLDTPWSLVPAAAAAVGGTWVLTRPS